MRKGEISSVIKIVLAIVIFIVIGGLLNFAAAGPIEDVLKLFAVQTDVISYEERCTEIPSTDANFESGSVDTFTMSLDYDVKDIKQFYLYFKTGWTIAGDWYLEWWRIACYSPSKGRDVELLRDTSGQWVKDNTMFSKMSNQGYGEDLGCGTSVKVYTKTGDDEWWTGTDGKVLLCYMRDRSSGSSASSTSSSSAPITGSGGDIVI